MSSEAKLQRTITELLASQPNDQRLRDHMEGLTRDENFEGLTWFWGPLLYARNRAMFRALIINNFSTTHVTMLRFQPVTWSQHAERLQAWLDQVRANRDTQLARRLLRWKYSVRNGWEIDANRWNAALLSDYRQAAGAAARATVLDEYDDWFELEEEFATSLYDIDRRSGQYILKHLPQAAWGSDKRKLWRRLALLAQEANDHSLYEELYRRQVPIKEWSAFAVHLAKHEADSAALCEKLERHHPRGFGLKLNGTLMQLLELRGRDVIPYVQTKLNDLTRGWFSNGTQPFVDFAEKNGWWDLWASAIRGCRDDKLFNVAVEKLLTDDAVADEHRLVRLQALAGVSREWNWSGFGWARIHALSDEIAVKLYARYPELVQGPFRAHVTPSWRGYPLLLKAAMLALDNELIDLLASRYVTRASNLGGWSLPGANKLLETADELSSYYDTLRQTDPSSFALRAANVLTRIPAFSIFSMTALLQTNKLARLLFVRSFEHYLAHPRAVRDLVEGSEIHVQMLAYRILAQDNDQARAMAVQSIDILIGTLLRPLHRKTRLVAFDALLSAARGDSACARQVLRRAHEALKLPDQRYPKEELVGLIGRILHHCPQLRSAREQPIIYGLAEATS